MRLLSASKKINNFDFTIGLGWGNLSNTGKIKNPLINLNEGFRNRASYDGNGVAGFYTAKQIKGDEMGAVINWDTFDEARMNQKGTIGMIIIKAQSAEEGEIISQKIDERFMNIKMQ